ncbi:S-layer homology domain-containing protein [Acetoanaerobium noterae]
MHHLSGADNLSNFSDTESILPYALPAMIWAIKHGIISAN